MTGKGLLPLAETAAAALVWAAVVLGSAVLALTLPVYTSAMTQALGVPASSGLSTGDVVKLSGQVRALVADTEYDPLPATWKGAPAFDSAAVSHLMDVRSVFAGARIAVGVCALLLAVYVGWCLARRRFSALSTGMTVGAVLLVAGMVLGLIAGLTSFEALFAAFHGLFFAAGTWTFPADSLLIRLFPERFWAVSGGLWAGLTVLGAVALAVCARLLRTNVATGNASRTANNV